MALPPVTRPGRAQFAKVLIFGPSGHGKTRFLGTAQQDARTKPMLLLDFEGGTQSLSGLDIDIIRMKGWKDYNDTFNAIADGEASAYKSLAIDSVSETQLFTFLNILDMTELERKAKHQDVDQLQQGDYGKSHMQMRRLLRRFRDLPMHIFFTALDKDVVEVREGTIKKPGLQGQMSEEIVGMMDVVGYLALGSVNPEAKEAQRSLFLKNKAKIRCKVRVPWGDLGVPDEIIDPTVTKLFDLLKIPTPTTTVGARPTVLSGAQGGKPNG